MKQRYIDFVPAKKGAPKRAAASGAVKVAIPPVNPIKKSAKPAPKPVVKPKSAPKKASKEVDFPEIDELFAARPNPAGVSTGFANSKLGVIEDYQPKFVKTEVKKRPLGGKTPEKPAVEEKKVEKKPTEKKADEKKPVEKKAPLPLGQRSPFLTTAKVEKRPLSKNVYAKKPPVTKEEPSGPVKIIAKPEKDSKVGLVIAIILTIILGTAAGTVAFLLLPK